ncbi:uncharacterized protein N7446_014006 [Penicillium canescens]|uniref:Uncharacterized protein n=1 Tax=Penicillium canescens TaxID=5083 RepID=A0AAD6I0Z5_PENCN|nr:uncharacterized protein N7446_014006 [Penicillium canescens]KAJ6023641.1 hypothetical protein N7460_014036 [Penicillium canescens]KAJ6025082.1 hypothetical protein N7444_012761 [Penicillium canescens]KAJ6042940.1 hypothetical protein N7446_014006 [Penicillium canescens]
MASVSGYSQATPRWIHLAHTGRAESHRVLLRRQASHAVSTRVFLRGRAVDEGSILPAGYSEKVTLVKGQERNNDVCDW